MGLPTSNEAGYRASSVLPYVEQLAGKLMLVQGLVDENVHARHTMRLIEALTTAARDYQLVLFPEARLCWLLRISVPTRALILARPVLFLSKRRTRYMA